MRTTRADLMREIDLTRGDLNSQLRGRAARSGRPVAAPRSDTLAGVDEILQTADRRLVSLG